MNNEDFEENIINKMIEDKDFDWLKWICKKRNY